MHSVIGDRPTVQTVLVVVESFELFVDVIYNGLARVGVIETVTVAGSVDDRQANFHTALFDVDGRAFDLNR